VVDGLAGDQRARFEAQLAGGNLEHALSRLRRIAACVPIERSTGTAG
jgi:hypothetical protein